MIKFEALTQPELRKVLFLHFKYLCANINWEEILSLIFSKAISAKSVEEKIVVEFPNDKRLIATPGVKGAQYAEWPDEFQKILQHHEDHMFPSEDWGVTLGQSPNFEPGDLGGEVASYSKDGYKLKSPLTVYSDWWIYHPELKRIDGREALVFVNHGSCDFEDVSTYAPEELFLKKLSEELGVPGSFPKAPELEIPKSDSSKEWWDDLSEDWKNFLIEQLDLQTNQVPTKRKIDNVTDLHFRKQHSIDDLTPILKFTGLKWLSLKKVEIEDLSILNQIIGLEELTIWSRTIDSLSFISGMNRLKSLVLSMPNLKHVEVISELEQLESLTIKKAKITSIDFTQNLKSLRWLDVSSPFITSIKALKNLNNLRYLCLKGTRVQEEEILAFQEMNPKCTVDYFKNK